MNIRTLTVAPLLLLLLSAQVVAGQTPNTAPRIRSVQPARGRGAAVEERRTHRVCGVWFLADLPRRSRGECRARSPAVSTGHIQRSIEHQPRRDADLCERRGARVGLPAAPRLAIRICRDRRRRVSTNRQRCLSQSRRERSACRLFWRRCACSDTQRPQRVRRRAREAGVGRRRRNIGPLAGARRRRVAFLNRRRSSASLLVPALDPDRHSYLTPDDDVESPAVALSPGSQIGPSRSPP